MNNKNEKGGLALHDLIQGINISKDEIRRGVVDGGQQHMDGLAQWQRFENDFQKLQAHKKRVPGVKVKKDY